MYLTLEIAIRPLPITSKSNLRLLRIQRIYNLLIRDIAHLVVLLLHQTLLIAYTVLPFRHETVTSVVGLTDIAHDTIPALIAIAGHTVGAAWFPGLLIHRRSTKRH